MSLPINIKDLVNAKTIESSRIEFKRGFNEEEIIRTMCAFANDIDELGGGYIIIGVEEKDGSPILPPIGIPQKEIESNGKKLVELSKKIDNEFFPAQVSHEEYVTDIYIMIIWVTTGEKRPYTAPTTLGKKAQRRIYVRQSSVTLPANKEQERRLRELAQHRHFDDRVNMRAWVSDLNLGLIQAYLQEIQSQLYVEAAKLPFEDLCLRMQIARGPKENIRPLNVGLLLFCKEPHTFFAGCKTNIVEFEDDAGTNYSDKTITGPIHLQIREIMNFLETNIIKQFTKKSEQELAVEKFNNYPYQALEELVVNSLYHRSYENSQPNEIRIYKNGSNRRIEILSYPGPLPPINNDALIQLNIVARNYRNIRLGDWLKNLRLAEKYATGIPTVVSSLDKNGSPKPILSTDEDRSYFLAVIQIHPDTPSSEQSSIDSSTNHVPLSDIQQEILDLLLDNPMLENVIKQKFGDNYPIDEDIDFLIEHELVSFSDILTLGKQFYITRRGIAALRNTF